MDSTDLIPLMYVALIPQDEAETVKFERTKLIPSAVVGISRTSSAQEGEL